MGFGRLRLLLVENEFQIDNFKGVVNPGEPKEVKNKVTEIW
jgi:hypothetical protein